MTFVSQLSDLTVLRSAIRLRADHLSSEPIQQAKRFPISLARTGTLPLISEAKPILPTDLSLSDRQPHPDRNQGRRFGSLLLQRVPDWGASGGAILGCDIPSLQRSYLPNRSPPASDLTDRGFLKFSPWPYWRQIFLPPDHPCGEARAAAVTIIHR
jgi:hypothetical protein